MLDPSHPYTVDDSNSKASIIFADGVDYAIEIKPDLTNKKEICRGLEQVRSVKQLVRKRNGIIFSKRYTKEQLDYANRIPAFIYSNKTCQNERLLISHIVDYYVEKRVPKIEQFDMILINHKMLLFNFRRSSFISKSDIEGIYYCSSESKILPLFLLWMNSLPKSEIEIGESIMKIYLEEIMEHDLNLSGYTDLNAKLLSIENG